MVTNFLRVAGSALTGVSFGLVGVFLYAQSTLSNAEETRAPLTTKVSGPIAMARPSAQPASSASDEPEDQQPATEGSAAAETDTIAKLHFTPAFAGVSVTGKALPTKDGVVELEGKPGDVLYVRLQVGGASQTFRVKLTETGPEPAALSFDTPAAGPRPKGAPAPAPVPAKAPPPSGGDDFYE
jgi:hypothetical protein